MEHPRYCVASVLVERLGCKKTYNNHVDHQQVIVWTFNGAEVMRSEAGNRTYTPLFKQLAIAKIEELFP